MVLCYICWCWVILMACIGLLGPRQCSGRLSRLCKCRKRVRHRGFSRGLVVHCKLWGSGLLL